MRSFTALWSWVACSLIFVALARTEHTVSSIGDLQTLVQDLRKSADPNDASFLFAVIYIYDASCAFSEALKPSIRMSSYETIILNIDSEEKLQLKQSFNVYETPAVLLLSANATNSFVTPYVGSHSLNDFEPTALHFFRTLSVFSDVPVLLQDQYRPKSFATIEQVWEFVSNHPLEDPVTLPVLSQSVENADTIQTLFTYQSPKLIFVQYGGCETADNEEKNVFTQFAQTLLPRRDRRFVRVCDDDKTIEANVQIYHPDGRLQHDCPSATLECLNLASSDAVYWFDRKTTLPIAFVEYRKVHALLVLNVVPHNREVLHEFIDVCTTHKDADRTLERDMVCLVVPYTETRLLTTFGIDIWQSSPEPVMIVTDQRMPGRTLQYRTASDFGTFVQSFWQGQLEPYVAPTTKVPRTNEFGVHELTTASFLETSFEPYDLLVLYSPTCGHCLKLLNIYDTMSELLRTIDWNISLYRLDLSEHDDSVLPITTKTLPALYAYKNGDWNRNETPQRNLFEILEWLAHDVIEDDAYLRTLLKQLPATA